jgi:hypothetical protein
MLFVYFRTDTVWFSDEAENFEYINQKQPDGEWRRTDRSSV